MGRAMIIRQRAIQAEDKLERHNAILDAAERVLLRSPELAANVAEVAAEAGLAKGTVYLYFPGKEELLLALHERNIEAFFDALIDRLDQQAPVQVDDILSYTHRYMIDPPLFLPMATRCLSQMGQGAAGANALAFKQRMGERLARAGAGLERHYPDLPANDGVVLLRHSYALILGLWQLSGAEACGPVAAGTLAEVPPYSTSIDDALRALWQGTIAATSRSPS